MATVLGLGSEDSLAQKPRGSIYTTSMELGTERPSPLRFWGPQFHNGSVYGPSGKIRAGRLEGASLSPRFCKVLGIFRALLTDHAHALVTGNVGALNN